MKKVFVLVIAILSMAGVSISLAQDRGTPAEAKELVKKAVAYVKEVGKEKALAEINNPKGRFIYKDIYVYAGLATGECLAHPITPALIGKNMINLKDADGKNFTREATEIAQKNGSGTVGYRWSHPQTKKVEKKETYFEMVNGIIIYCGYYK